MKILLHACCAPCAVKCVEILQKEGDTSLFWCNPNIHPLTEYRARRSALEAYAKDIGVEYFEKGGYGLQEYLSAIWPNTSSRCATCYKMRLDQTAKYASENGFDAFSTTLLISPYQDHNLIIEIAKAAAEKYGATLLYRDFRPYFREGQAQARALGLYMQKYCGCIFSEQERYSKKKG